MNTATLDARIREAHRTRREWTASRPGRPPVKLLGLVLDAAAPLEHEAAGRRKRAPENFRRRVLEAARGLGPAAGSVAVAAAIGLGYEHYPRVSCAMARLRAAGKLPPPVRRGGGPLEHEAAGRRKRAPENFRRRVLEAARGLGPAAGSVAVAAAIGLGHEHCPRISCVMAKLRAAGKLPPLVRRRGATP